jgi:hypothetical protein
MSLRCVRRMIVFTNLCDQLLNVYIIRQHLLSKKLWISDFEAMACAAMEIDSCSGRIQMSAKLIWIRYWYLLSKRMALLPLSYYHFAGTHIGSGFCELYWTARDTRCQRLAPFHSLTLIYIYIYINNNPLFHRPRGFSAQYLAQLMAPLFRRDLLPLKGSWLESNTAYEYRPCVHTMQSDITFKAVKDRIYSRLSFVWMNQEWNRSLSEKSQKTFY